MKAGKLSDTIYDRTIYKTIQSINKSADLKSDCTFLCGTNTTGHAEGKDSYVIFRACQDALNKLAAMGIIAGSVEALFEISLEVWFPSSVREAKLRGMVEYATQELAKINVTIGSLNVTVMPGIEEAIVSAFAQTNAKTNFENKCKPNQDVVMTKWIALEGSSLIAAKNHRELETRYPARLIDDACGYINYISVIPEAAGAMKSNVSAMHAVREGGIFGGLWEFATKSDVGLVIDLKKIPVKQETIEVCEFYDINPYKLLAGGSLLIACDHGMTLVSELERNGIHASVIGKTTANNDRIITNEDESRFLEQTREDDYYTVMYPQTTDSIEE